MIEQRSQLSILAGVAAALSTSRDLEAGIGAALDACVVAGGISCGALYRLDGAQALCLTHDAGFPASARSELVDGFGELGLLAQVAAGTKISSLASPPHGVASAILVPLVGGGRTVGVLVLGSTCATSQPEHLAFGLALGVFLGQALVMTEALAGERAAGIAAVEARRTKDEFLALLGHELRNPLAPIVTSLGLLRTRNSSDGGGAERRVIERQVNHLVRLVDDLLDVSRITQGTIELRRSRFQLAEAVARAVDTVGPLIKLRGHHLAVEVPATGLTIHGDRDRVVQVICNLLSNAAKYTEPGGRILLGAERDGDHAVLRVRDSGIGITAEMLPTIFEAFTQERQGIDRAQGGLGLGLTIVGSMVALHGGTVTARSDGLGKGTELTVRLPAEVMELEAPDSVVDIDTAPIALTVTSRRILIVDDNRDAAETIAGLYEDLGHVTCVAFDGPSALAVADHFRPDLVLLDIGLPVMDGYTLVGKLRALPRVAIAHFVAVTGYGRAGDRAKALGAGFDEHVVKPVTCALLLGLLEHGVVSAPAA